jgi:hypothetical protein
MKIKSAIVSALGVSMLACGYAMGGGGRRCTTSKTITIDAPAARSGT